MPGSEEFLALILFGLLGLFVCMALVGLSVGLEKAIKTRRWDMKKNWKQREYYVRLCTFSEIAYREQRRNRQLQLIESWGLWVFDAVDDLPSYEEATEVGITEDLPDYQQALCVSENCCKPPEYEIV